MSRHHPDYTEEEACSGDWSFAISRRTRLPQLSAHARDDANLRTVNRGPLISKFKRDVRLFQTALSFLLFPSFYYVLESFVFRLRLCRNTSLEAIISLYKRPSSSESRFLLCHRRFSVGCCRYPRFWVPWPPREDSWSHTPYAAPHLPSFTKSNSAFEPVLVLNRPP
jgi:hypothetical protein